MVCGEITMLYASKISKSFSMLDYICFLDYLEDFKF